MTERIYVINIRKATLKAPRWKKSKRGVAIVREFLKRHMKVDEVKIGKSITEGIWEGGAKKILGKIRVKAVEIEEGEGDKKRKVVKAELLEVIPEEVREEKIEEKKPLEKESRGTKEENKTKKEKKK